MLKAEQAIHVFSVFFQNVGHQPFFNENKQAFQYQWVFIIDFVRKLIDLFDEQTVAVALLLVIDVRSLTKQFLLYGEMILGIRFQMFKERHNLYLVQLSSIFLLLVQLQVNPKKSLMLFIEDLYAQVKPIFPKQGGGHSVVI
jgi:hypothetical protein